MAKTNLRAERALATRRRMIAAAYRLFCRDGYTGTTMNAIADEAGVAVQTLYYTFHTKAALLADALGGAILGFDRWREPPADPQMRELLPWHDWWHEFEAAPTSAAALGVFVSNGAAILERVGPLMPALHGAGGDPEAAAVARDAEDRRVETYRAIVDVVAAKEPGLRPGLTPARATDIVLALFSAETYDALANGRGWSRRRCTTLFGDLLGHELLGPEHPTP